MACEHAHLPLINAIILNLIRIFPTYSNFKICADFTLGTCMPSQMQSRQSQRALNSSRLDGGTSRYLICARSAETCYPRSQRRSPCQGGLLSSPWAFNWLTINLQLFFCTRSPGAIIKQFAPAVADTGADFFLFFYSRLGGLTVFGKISFGSVFTVLLNSSTRAAAYLKRMCHSNAERQSRRQQRGSPSAPTIKEYQLASGCDRAVWL